MTAWPFWGEKKFANVYENIYIRSSVEDWFNLVAEVAREIDSVSANPKHILDVGCGEGHTTKQVLDRVTGEYVCDLLEPDADALASAVTFLKQENTIGESFAEPLSTFTTEKKYDVIFTSHTNYYWSDEQVGYDAQLEKLTAMLAEGGKLIILTLPEQSGHYRIMLHQVYPTFNYAEYITDFYRNTGHKTEVKEVQMRLFIGDLLTTTSKYDVGIFYRFIHNTDSFPTANEAAKFLGKIKEIQHGGYVDFKDHLITVSR